MAVTNTLAYYRTAVKSFIEEDPEKNKKVGDQNSGDSSNRLEHKMDLFYFVAVPCYSITFFAHP